MCFLPASRPADTKTLKPLSLNALLLLCCVGTDLSEDTVTKAVPKPSSYLSSATGQIPLQVSSSSRTVDTVGEEVSWSSAPALPCLCQDSSLLPTSPAPGSSPHQPASPHLHSQHTDWPVHRWELDMEWMWCCRLAEKNELSQNSTRSINYLREKTPSVTLHITQNQCKAKAHLHNVQPQLYLSNQKNLQKDFTFVTR